MQKFVKREITQLRNANGDPWFGSKRRWWWWWWWWKGGKGKLVAAVEFKRGEVIGVSPVKDVLTTL